MATPILHVDDIFVSEGPNATAIFFLRLSQPAAVAASLSYFWSSGSADGITQPTDFPGVGSNGSVSFAVGESVKAITIPIIEDSLVEGPESFTLTFTSPVNLVLARTSAVVTIVDNDTISVMPLVFVTDTWVNETDGVAFFNITLTQASATAITVNYQTMAMTALAGNDFIADASSVTFAPGETTKTVMLELLDDGVVEGREKFGLQLTSATGGAVVGDPLGTATIAPSDGATAVTPTLDVSDVTVTEGPVAVAAFVLTLSQPSGGVTSVRYSLQPATADFLAGTLRNVDYLGVSGIVTFDAGETVRTVNVPITNDTAIEPAEIFFLQLSEPNGLTLSRSYVPATIIDNDSVGAAPLVSVSDLHVNESDGEAQFVITLDRASTSTVTIDFQTSDASALAGSDYVGLKSSVVFLPGETAKTIAVTLNDDASSEIDERFALRLTGASGGAVLFDAEGTAVIAQNDGTLAASPILVIEDIVVGENAPVSFVLRLTQPSAGPATVTYAVSGGTAVTSNDYWYNSDTVRFAPGETVKVVTLSNIDNAVVEQAEYLQFSLSNPQGMTLSRTRVIANIIDNDTKGAAPSVTVSDAIVNEGSGEAQFHVVLDRASTVPVTITYKTTDGSAAAGSDFVATTSTVTFLPGDIAKTITIQLLEDAQAEPDEQFVVDLTSATGGAVLVDATGTATISHNDGLTSASPVLNVDDVVVSEGPNSFATFVLRLNRPSNSTTTVSYNAEFSTADSGLDYGYVTDTIRFAPGETVRTVKIPIIDDNDVEGINSVRLLLSSPQGLSLGKANAVGKIIDNDTIGTAPLIRAGDAVANESDGFARVAITLDRASTSTIAVTYQTVNGQALAGSDFVGVSSSVTFLPGETAKTVSIQLVDDAGAEAEERFGLTLTNATGGGVLGHDEGIVTIARSDGAVALQPVLNVADIVVGEGGDSMMTFVLRLSRPSSAATSVSFNPTGGTSGSTFDYRYMPDTVTFAPGETVKTFSIPIVQDSENEQAETLSLVLSSPQGLTLGRPLAMATIVDDDTTLATPLLSVGDVYVNESDGEAYFSLTFNGATTTPVTVTFQTVDGLAVAGTNYVARSGSVIFMPGETAKTVGVQLIDDGLPQLDATFGLRITGVTGSAVVADGVGTALIGRNDLPAVALPVLRVDDILVSEGGLSLATFVLRLSQPATALASVTVGLAFGGTANFADYKDLGSYAVTFGVGETIKTFSIPLVDDGSPENAETLLLGLHSATGMTIERSTVVGTIIDNDGPVLVAGVDSLKAEGQAGSTAMTFAVILKEALPSIQVLNWSVAGFGNRAASATDFVGNALPGGSLTFASGETLKLVTVNVAGDSVFEGDETFVVTITDPPGTLGIGTVQALGTIVDDDTAAVTISAMTTSAMEGNAGSNLYTFTVSLGQAATAPQSVGWAVSGSGVHAASAADFVGGAFPSGTVDFAIGETSKTIAVTVAADAQFEPDETFIVGVTSTTGLPVGSFLAQATILNDDTLSVSIAALSATRAEGQSGGTAFIFTVSLDAAATSTLSVSWAVAGSGPNPADGSDFAGGIAPSGTVTFAASEVSRMITVNLASDAAIEADEAFSVTLTGSASGLTIGTATASGTILNDDSSVSIAALSATKAEGQTGFTFTATRTGDISVAQTVSAAVSGSGATPASGGDFVGGILPTWIITFAAGETSKIVAVDVVDDSLVEGNETFALTLSNPSAGLVLGTASAMGTIQNDDASVSIAAASADKPEGDSGTTPFTFTATRAGDISVTHSVAWSIVGSGADGADPSDFGSGPLDGGTLTFAPGETTKTVSLPVVGDTEVEADEQFTISLQNPTAGLTIQTGSAIGTIRSDDGPPPTVSIAAAASVKAEGNSGSTAFTFTVSRAGSVAAGATVSYSVTGSAANPANAADFAGNVLQSGVVSFSAGEIARTLTINVRGDATVEPDNGFVVTLANPSAGSTLGTASANGTILNDDLTAHDDAYVILQGTSLTAAAAIGVLSNDEANPPVTATLQANAVHGQLQLAANGGVTYAPAGTFAGVDSFGYRAAGANGAADDAEVHVYVVPVQVGAATTLNLLALTAEQQIASTYAAFFGRAADAGGFAFWVGEFVQGLPTQGPAVLFANIASSFGISAEARALYPFLLDPSGASAGQISAFLESIYDNLFNRASDPAGLAYWTGQIQQTLASGQFVGSVLINIMSGAQDTVAGRDITTLMGKVAVSLAYVREQQEHGTAWAGASDVAAATALLDAVTDAPQTVLTGIRNAETLIADHP